MDRYRESHTVFTGLNVEVALQGEVVAGLHTKMKYKRDSFCCLVAEGPAGNLVGVVEISLQAEKVHIVCQAPSESCHR